MMTPVMEILDHNNLPLATLQKMLGKNLSFSRNWGFFSQNEHFFSQIGEFFAVYMYSIVGHLKMTISELRYLVVVTDKFLSPCIYSTMGLQTELITSIGNIL